MSARRDNLKDAAVILAVVCGGLALAVWIIWLAFWILR